MLLLSGVWFFTDRAEPLIPREKGVELRGYKLPGQKSPGESMTCCFGSFASLAGSTAFFVFAPFKGI